MLSLSDKSTGDVLGNVDVDYTLLGLSVRGTPPGLLRLVGFGVLEWGVLCIPTPTPIVKSSDNL